jgi:hypothetical protein
MPNWRVPEARCLRHGEYAEKFEARGPRAREGHVPLGWHPGYGRAS